MDGMMESGGAVFSAERINQVKKAQMKEIEDNIWRIHINKLIVQLDNDNIDELRVTIENLIKGLNFNETATVLNLTGKNKVELIDKIIHQPRLSFYDKMIILNSFKKVFQEDNKMMLHLIDLKVISLIIREKMDYIYFENIGKTGYATYIKLKMKEISEKIKQLPNIDPYIEREIYNMVALYYFQIGEFKNGSEIVKEMCGEEIETPISNIDYNPNITSTTLKMIKNYWFYSIINSHKKVFEIYFLKDEGEKKNHITQINNQINSLKHFIKWIITGENNKFSDDIKNSSLDSFKDLLSVSSQIINIQDHEYKKDSCIILLCILIISLNIKLLINSLKGQIATEMPESELLKKFINENRNNIEELIGADRSPESQYILSLYSLVIEQDRGIRNAGYYIMKDFYKEGGGDIKRLIERIMYNRYNIYKSGLIVGSFEHQFFMSIIEKVDQQFSETIKSEKGKKLRSNHDEFLTLLESDNITLKKLETAIGRNIQNIFPYAEYKIVYLKSLKYPFRNIPVNRNPDTPNDIEVILKIRRLTKNMDENISINEIKSLFPRYNNKGILNMIISLLGKDNSENTSIQSSDQAIESSFRILVNQISNKIISDVPLIIYLNRKIYLVINEEIALELYVFDDDLINYYQKIFQQHYPIIKKIIEGIIDFTETEKYKQIYRENLKTESLEKKKNFKKQEVIIRYLCDNLDIEFDEKVNDSILALISTDIPDIESDNGKFHGADLFRGLCNLHENTSSGAITRLTLLQLISNKDYIREISTLKNIGKILPHDIQKKLSPHLRKILYQPSIDNENMRQLIEHIINKFKEIYSVYEDSFQNTAENQLVCIGKLIDEIMSLKIIRKLDQINEMRKRKNDPAIELAFLLDFSLTNDHINIGRTKYKFKQSEQDEWRIFAITARKETDIRNWLENIFSNRINNIFSLLSHKQITKQYGIGEEILDNLSNSHIKSNIRDMIIKFYRPSYEKLIPDLNARKNQ